MQKVRVLLEVLPCGIVRGQARMEKEVTSVRIAEVSSRNQVVTKPPRFFGHQQQSVDFLRFPFGLGWVRLGPPCRAGTSLLRRCIKRTRTDTFVLITMVVGGTSSYYMQCLMVILIRVSCPCLLCFCTVLWYLS